MVDEPTQQLPVPPEGGEVPESTTKDRPPGGLLLVTAAVAGVLCLGGGGLALFGVLPQPARPIFSHSGNAAIGQDNGPGQVDATDHPATTTGPTSPPASSTSPAPPGSTTTGASSTASAASAMPLPSAGGPASPSVVVFYATCADAKAAGAAPLHAGQPGYRSELDHDHDGVACEKNDKEK
jgi:hypothetical protein